MTVEHLRNAMHADPFVPFRIHLASGKTIPVTDPDSISMSRTGRVATVFGPNEEFFRIDTLLVTALEVDAMDASGVPAPPVLEN